MQHLVACLAQRGLPAYIPDPDSAEWDEATPERLLILKRLASYEHLRRVRSKTNGAVLAVNLDRDGIADYIGANTFAELAHAFAHRKRIYLWQGVPEAYEDELRAWGAICLQGDLDRLVQRELDCAAVAGNQLQLFSSKQLHLFNQSGSLAG